MLRRVLSGFLETVLQGNPEPVAYQNAFAKPETVPFAWLSSVAPCFPVSATNITILSEPQEFYKAIKSGCEGATRRITLVSLYLGTSELEAKLVQTVLKNEHFQLGKLKVNVLLDYMRGSRFKNNSRKMLLPLLQAGGDCSVSLYHTPFLRGLMKRITPERWNELCGLQHMKVYIFDDVLVMSGANLSNDYFTNRQDRYFVIKNKKLCDFYCDLVSKVQRFSLQMDANDDISLHEEWDISPYQGSQAEFVRKASNLIDNYIVEMRNEQNLHQQELFDTWIFPLVQMGQLGVHQDCEATDKILAEAPGTSVLHIASGYFNLTKQYMQTLINTEAECKILMAHPQANGFLGAKGPAGGIPYAYSLIARQFQNELEKFGQQGRVTLFEYLRPRWTYHGKGLWYYPPKGALPCLTLIGSPNFGERSVKRDLETQLAIVTENAEFRQKLHDECEKLFEFGQTAQTERRVALWVHAFVFFFRNFF